MKSTTVRITPKTHYVLQNISNQSGEPMQCVISKAVELYRRKYFLSKANKAFAAVRENSRAWNHEQKERKEWDITLLDGIDE